MKCIKLLINHLYYFSHTIVEKSIENIDDYYVDLLNDYDNTSYSNVNN